MTQKRKSIKYPTRTVSDVLTDPAGREVVIVETLPLQAGQEIRMVVEQVNSPWQQGVWLATNGALQIDGEPSTRPQFVIWADSAPFELAIKCLESDGWLRFYNVWNTGDRTGFESLSHTSGMAVDDLGDGWRRYGCHDFGYDPDFTKLVFRICIT